MGARDTTAPPFTAVLDQHGRALLRFCISQAGPDRGEDIFQETMISALRAYGTLENPAAVKSWLFSIAARKAIDSHRAAARGPVSIADVEHADARAAADPASAAFADPASAAFADPASAAFADPASAALADPAAVGFGDPASATWGDPASATAAELWRGVARLPEKQRQAVALRYIADLSHREIGQMMGTSEPAARRNVFEGVRRLRDDLTDAPR